MRANQWTQVVLALVFIAAPAVAKDADEDTGGLNFSRFSGGYSQVSEAQTFAVPGRPVETLGGGYNQFLVAWDFGFVTFPTGLGGKAGLDGQLALGHRGLDGGGLFGMARVSFPFTVLELGPLQVAGGLGFELDVPVKVRFDLLAAVRVGLDLDWVRLRAEYDRGLKEPVYSKPLDQGTHALRVSASFFFFYVGLSYRGTTTVSQGTASGGPGNPNLISTDTNSLTELGIFLGYGK